MAGSPLNPQYAPLYVAAGRAYNIPPAILAGVADVETNGGQNISVSSTGAQGLMQFEPGTAKGLGVNPANPRSAIFGAAKLLTQYGYHQNPLRAIGAYNGGPGNPQMGYANQVMQSARRLSGALKGTSAQAPRAAAQTGMTPATYVQGSKNVFDQQGFQQAQKAFIAGNFLAHQANPFDIGPKTPGESNPLLASGLLTTKAPDAQSFTTAQTTLQKIAGTPLRTHPGASTNAILNQATQSAAGAPAGAQRILAMAKAAIGGPYNQATHATAFTASAATLRKSGTDCSGFVSWLMGPDGLGIWRSALATPDIPHAPGIQQGRGRNITIWNNPLPGNSGHVFIQILGQFFQSAGGGTGIQPISTAAAASMIRSGDNGARYYTLHPKGA